MCRKKSGCFGYFALPVLVGDDIVAAHRSQDRSQGRRVTAAEMELGRPCAGRGARKDLKRRIEQELHRFERFQLAEESSARRLCS